MLIFLDTFVDCIRSIEVDSTIREIYRINGNVKARSSDLDGAFLILILGFKWFLTMVWVVLMM